MLLALNALSYLTEAGQICSSCSGVELPEVCQHHIECRNDEKCYVHQYITESGLDLADLGCTTAPACPHSLESVFGKRDETEFGKRDEGHHFKCMSCCNDTAVCNQNMTCTGTTNPGLTLPKDCSELVVPNRKSGSYVIFPYGLPHLPVSVYCEFDGNDAWTVVQRRFKGSVSFYQSWNAYKKGFGTSNGEYWLGNDVIHQMTAAGNYKLKIILTDWSNVTKYAEYGTFRIAGESHEYSLSIWGYSGTAGDDMDYNDGMEFTTYDRDNDKLSSGNCADSQHYESGWWFNSCLYANLNAHYYTSSVPGGSWKGIIWNKWHGHQYSLKGTKMMIRK